jgi:adenosylcobinamide kinase/adenosylcobinamide-phosphate guanylyltransferase
MSELILILGGARSGKSRFAQQIALELDERDVLFVATAEVYDHEMEQRVRAHQQERPPVCDTLEAARHVGAAIAQQASSRRVIVIDCLTLLTSNVLLAFEDPFDPAAERELLGEVEALIDAARQHHGTTIIVSNEVGMGLVPANPLGRAYRDLLGKANQLLAQSAQRVYFLVAGIPVTVKA